jgi:hypothetical protein
MSTPAETRPVYLYRADGTDGNTATVMCAAPIDLVVAAYGGGGSEDQDGLCNAFGGGVFYRNAETGERYAGVWGARNASRFRSALRRKAEITVVNAPPPSFVAWWRAGGERPPTALQHGLP